MNSPDLITSPGVGSSPTTTKQAKPTGKLPTITSAATATGTVSHPFSYQITASEAPSRYESAGLPAGLAVNTTTGLVSGTPNVPGSFTVTISAANSCGKNSKSLVLTIKSPLPAATTTAASEVTPRSAKLNATVNPKGQPATVHFEYGQTTAYGTATPASSLASGTSAVPVQAAISALNPGTTYHFRIVAANTNGSTEGPDQAFTTLAVKADPKLPAIGVQEPPAAPIKDLSTPSGVAPRSRKLRPKGRLFREHGLLLLTVVIPTILAAIYYGLIASDIYISESRFVVKGQKDSPVSGGLGVFLQNAGFSRSQEDTYSVHDYMLSRDALKQLNDELSLINAFGSSEVDRISRFGGLDGDRSFEALHRYYGNHIALNLDTASSITTLKVSAFKSEDALRINEMLLKMGETLVNQLNERGQQDIIRFATAELELAGKKAQTAALALSSYRSNNTLVDPSGQSKLQLELISKLQDELITAQTLLFQARTFSPDSPQIPLLKNRTESLQSEMNSQMARLTGSDASSLNSKAPEYERLALEQDFAAKHLLAALASYQQALNDAQSKRLYLERIVQPSKPDVAVEPRRIRAVLATFIVGLIVWGVLTILIAGIREHHD